MKRLALLFVCGALVCSAQEVRLVRAAILKSERSIISLKAGSMVDLLERGETVHKVRFNNHTGTIPANSLTEAEAPKKEVVKPSAPPQKSGSHYVNAVNKAKENANKHDKNNAHPANEVLEN